MSKNRFTKNIFTFGKEKIVHGNKAVRECGNMTIAYDADDRAARRFAGEAAAALLQDDPNVRLEDSAVPSLCNKEGKLRILHPDCTIRNGLPQTYNRRI